jgi:hypothetical protein
VPYVLGLACTGSLLEDVEREPRSKLQSFSYSATFFRNVLLLTDKDDRVAQRLIPREAASSRKQHHVSPISDSSNRTEPLLANTFRPFMQGLCRHEFLKGANFESNSVSFMADKKDEPM